MSGPFSRCALAVAALTLSARVGAETVPPPGGGPAAGRSLQVRVVGGRAGVYASTNAVREAVVWVAPGTELAVRGDYPDEGAWVGVEAPESVVVWVYRELVRDGVVASDKSRIRSGAGLNYRVVGSLNKGDRVEVRGAYGDWLRIRPPSGLAFWMLRDQVEPLAEMPPEGMVWEDGEAPNGVSAAAPSTMFTRLVDELTNAVVATQPVSAPAEVPPELRGLEIADAPGQGTRVQLTGVLDWRTVGGLAVPCSLMARQENGDLRPLCYLSVAATTVRELIGATVVVDGTRWIVGGVELPVIVVLSLRVIE